LLSSTHSSRHSGNSVDCPRSAPSTKRFMNCPPANRQANHSRQFVFTQPGSDSDICVFLNDVRSKPTNGSRAARTARPFRATSGLMHRKQRLTRSPPSARVSSDCGTDGQQRCIDYSHRAGAYSAWRRPNVQLRRQTNQQRRNGWHEPAGHDRTMQLFMAFA
jgi:hypothetical protein